MMISYKFFLGLVVVVSMMATTVMGKAGAWPDTKVNKVWSECPSGETFYRGCVRCPCIATIPPETKDQYPEHHLKVCAGEVPPTDCPNFTCATSKKFLATTPCEGACTCNPKTKITTCKRHPCPYE